MQSAIVFYAGGNTFFYLLVPGIMYLVLFVMGGFGLYRMASRRKIKHKWRAFVPFANTYLLGELAGNNCTFFGARLKLVKLWVTISEVLAVLVGGFAIFCTIFLYSGFYSETWTYTEKEYYGETYLIIGWDVSKMTVTQKAFYYGSLNCYGKLYYLFEIIYYLFFVTAIMNVFRRYAPAQSTMYTLLSVFFPIENIFIFAVSGNREVNYNDYVKARYARYRNRYNNPPPYGGYYGGGSGYNYDPYTGQPINRGGSGNSKSSSDNSSDTSDGGDPFPEFNSDKGGGSSSGSSGSSSDSSNPFDL